MKIINALVSASILLFTSCSQNVQNSANKAHSEGDSSNASSGQTTEHAFAAKMNILQPVAPGDSINLKFTVYNNSDSSRTFCKWHTPFEPLMSKYLDITNANGEDVQYTGAMAKRVTPPPASSYITVAAHDSLSATVNLLKAYSITEPSTYTVRYNSEGISGLTVKDSISFTLKR